MSLPDTLRTLDQEATPGLPCPNPWCSSHTTNALRRKAYAPYLKLYRDGHYRVVCAVCPQVGPLGVDGAAAITAWNTRSHLEAGWQPIETADRTNGKRLILAWDDCPSLPYHWEVGRWSRTLGWVNTYGHAFSGEPTHWMEPPPPSAPPSIPHPPAGKSDRG